MRLSGKDGPRIQPAFQQAAEKAFGKFQ